MSDAGDTNAGEAGVSGRSGDINGIDWLFGILSHETSKSRIRSAHPILP